MKREPLYIWAINDSWHAGVPDHYYSGDKADLWAEYKYFPTDRGKFDLRKPSKTPKLTRPQQNWLNTQHDRGRNVWVIVGMPSGGIILRRKDWMKPVTVLHLSTREEIAKEIKMMTLSPL